MINLRITLLIPLLATLFLAGIGNCFGQCGSIILTNKDSGKEKTIREGKSVILFCKNENVVKGEFRVINDSTLKVDTTVVSLKDIEIIKIYPYHKAGEILLTVASIYEVAGGIALLITYNSNMGTGGQILGKLLGLSAVTSGAMVLIPSVALLLSQKKYTTEKYKVSLKN